jgi:hypothetical protein
MRSKLLVLSVTVLALLLVSAAFTPSDARSHSSYSGARSYSHAGPRVYSAPRAYSGVHPGARYVHRDHHHRRVFIGAPVLYGTYYYYDDCGWLRYRALRTGSPYWWNRYYACIYAY